MNEATIIICGKELLLDEKDKGRLEGCSMWLCRGNRDKIYVMVRTVDGVQIPLHRLLIGASRGKVVDHVNGDGLDNRRVNLRLCTIAENRYNSRMNKKRKKYASRFKGVQPSYSALKRGQKRWLAFITHKKKRHYLGYFANEVDAAQAYNRVATKLFGEFAYLNTLA